MPFFFPLYIPALPRATADYTKPHAAFFCSFLWLFLSYTRDFISLFVQLTVTCRGQFLPGVLRGSPRRRLNRLLSQTGSWKIEFAGGPPGPPKLFFLLYFFCCSYPSAPNLWLNQIAFCSGFPIQKQAMPAIFHRARTTCPLFSYTEYIASLNFCLLLAYVIARYSASLASRILTSRPTYAEKLQGYKNLSPRSNTLPLAGHANTSFLTFAVPKKNLIHVFSGHWPLFFAFFCRHFGHFLHYHAD